MWNNRASHGEALCVSSLGVCRLCMLEGCSSMESIFRSTIPSCVANKIASVTRLSLTEEDGLPTMVCQQCLFQLDVADTFIRRCVQSDKSFRLLLTQGEVGSVSTGNGNLVPINRGPAAELVGVFVASSDTVGPVLGSRIDQDPDEQINQITEHPIKLEIADGTLYYEEQDTEECTEELHSDDFFENDTSNNISIKMEELVDSTNGGMKEYSDDVVTGPEICTVAEPEVIQTLSLVEKNHKCSVCSSEFTTKRGLACHFRHHLIQKKKEKLMAFLKESKIRKQAKAKNDIDSLVSNLEGERFNACPMPINDSSQEKERTLPPQGEIIVPQPLAKRFKCALCPADFPSRVSLSLHCRRAKDHKKKIEGPFHSTGNPSRQISEVSVADRQEKTVGASSHGQVVCINKLANEPDSEMVDNAIDTPSYVTATGGQGYESLDQPKRNQSLSVTNKFKCSICTLKFTTKLKRSLHICQGKGYREKILQRQLRVRAPKTKSEPLVQDDNLSPGNELNGIGKNTNDIPQKESEIISVPPLMSVDSKGPAKPLQEQDSEKSSNVVTTQREKAEPEMQAKPYLLNRYRCDICSVGFRLSFQLAGHMRTAKHHKNSKLHQYLPRRTVHTKSVKVPRSTENIGNLSNKKLSSQYNVYDVSVALKVDDTSANANLMLEGTNDGEPEIRLDFQPPLSKDQIACMPTNTRTNKEPVTRDEKISGLVANSKGLECVSRLLKFSSALELTCHTNDFNSKEVLDEPGKQSLSNVTGEDIVSENAQNEATELTESSSLANQQQVETAWAHVGNVPQVPTETFKSFNTPSKLLLASDCAQTSQARIRPKRVLKQELIKLRSQSEAVGKGLAKTHIDDSLECNGQVANEKGSELQINSNVIMDKGQEAKKLTTSVGNDQLLPSTETFPRGSKLTVLEHFNGDLQVILGRKLVVQLNRLAVSKGGEEEVVIDCEQKTQSKSSDSNFQKLSGNGNLNEKSKPNLQKSTKSADLCNSERMSEYTQKQPSASKKEVEIYKEIGSHVEGCKLQPKAFKCKICSLECISPSSLGGHMNQHKNIARRKSFCKVSQDDASFTQSFRSSRNPDIHANVASDTNRDNTSMQQCKIKLSCSVCSVQFSTELSLANHLKFHKKYQRKATLPTTPNSALKAGEDPSISCKTPRSSCDGCLKTFASWDTLKVHKLRHPCGKMPYQCHLCSKGFHRRCNRNAHIKSAHHKQLPVQADHSKEKEKNKIHSQSSSQLPATQEDTLEYIRTRMPCDGCSKSFPSFEALRKHKLNHFCGTKPYNCKICSLTFNSAFERRAHVNSWHIGLETGLNNVNAEMYPKNCEFCNQVLVDEDGRIQHINRHSKEAQCHICEKICPSSYGLKIHLVTHTTLRPYPCSDCPLAFKRKHHLVNHRYRHHDLGNKGKLKVTHASFKKQLRKVKGQGKVAFKPQKAKLRDSLACSFCDWTCKKKEDMESHIYTHGSKQNKRFSCQICSRDFKTQCNFTRHMSKHAPKFKS